MPQKSVTWTIGKQKNIALIAHDSQKPVIIQWCEEHKDILKEHFLHGTGAHRPDRSPIVPACRCGDITAAR